jgi:Domain of unknown function (DUF5615)
VADPIRWYMDEHVPLAVADGLRRRGVDVQTTQEAGMLHASDELQLAYATRQGRAILTQDDDFLALAAASTPHAGIAYAPQGTSIGQLVRGLMLITEIYTAEELTGRVEFL